MFGFFRKKELLPLEDREAIINAIRNAESQTSGEIRLFVESRCRYVDPLDRAGEIFWGLKMDQTRDRNGVLVYVALRDKQLAIFGDEGIHQKVGSAFWESEVQKMIRHFNRNNYADGMVTIIQDIGNALQSNFPYDKVSDKNELPDDIVFGR